MNVHPAELCRLINDAFGGMEYPGDEGIVMINSERDLESEEIKNALKGVHWRDVPFETLNRLRSALPFLSPEGYRFYLPAFMIIAIVDFYGVDVLPDEVIRTLTLPVDADMERVRALAEVNPEIQPLSQDDWQRTLKAVNEAYSSGGMALAFFNRVRGFSAKQCSVIRQFLEYVRDTYKDEFPDNAPQVALERYWRQC